MSGIKTKSFLAALILGALSVNAAAHGVTPRLDQREANQRARIEHRVHDGSLTRAEMLYLARQQQHIRIMEARARADGRVTAAERARIARALEVQSREIRRLAQNEYHR